MHFLGRCTAVLGGLLLASLPALAQPAAKEAADLRKASCEGCHGEKGDSAEGSVPRLNGQHGPYLRGRLESFRYPIRESPRQIHAMGDLAQRLNRPVIAALADYYAGQTSFQPLGAPRDSAAGERLYMKGAKDIPACAGCHGQAGEGGGRVPRIAGQHTRYLTLELQSFAIAGRIADPMNHHVWKITPEQIGALAAYLGR